MPKTAVHKNDGPESGKNNIGFAGKVLSVKAKAISHPVEKAAHGFLGGGVFSANPRHVPASLFGRYVVNHPWRIPTVHIRCQLSLLPGAAEPRFRSVLLSRFLNHETENHPGMTESSRLLDE